MATTLNQTSQRPYQPVRPTVAQNRRSEGEQRSGPSRNSVKSEKPGNPVKSPSPRRAAPIQRTPQPPPTAIPTGQPPRGRGAGLTVEKTFTVLGLTVGALLVLLFGVDLAVAFPFHRVSLTFDSGSVVSGALLLYLSIDVLRDQRRAGLW